MPTLSNFKQHIHPKMIYSRLDEFFNSELSDFDSPVVLDHRRFLLADGIWTVSEF